MRRISGTEAELLEADHPSGAVFHEDDFFAGLFADVFAMGIFELDSEGPARGIVEESAQSGGPRLHDA